MNDNAGRETLVHGLIASAVAIGAWLIIVEPKISELTDLEAEIAEILQEQPDILGVTLEQVGGRVVGLREELAQIETWNATASDSSLWYDRITRLALDHGLTVHSVQPGTLMSADENVAVATSRIDVSVEGSYVAVADFLDDLMGVEGYLRPQAVNLSPTMRGGLPALLATFSGEALEFRIPEALRALQGETDGG